MVYRFGRKDFRAIYLISDHFIQVELTRKSITPLVTDDIKQKNESMLHFPCALTVEEEKINIIYIE